MADQSRGRGSRRHGRRGRSDGGSGRSNGHSHGGADGYSHGGRGRSDGYSHGGRVYSRGGYGDSMQVHSFEHQGNGLDHTGRGGHVSRGGHASRGRGSGGHPTTQYVLSEEELQTLAQGSPDDVLLKVNENESKFLKAYQKKYYCSHPLRLKQLIKLLYLLVRCEDKSTASKMLAQILSASGEYAFFTTKIDLLLKNMPLEGKGYVRKENPTYIEHLVDIGCMAIQMIPSTVVQTYPITVIEATIGDLTESGEDMHIVTLKFEELNSAFKLAKQRALKEMMQKKKTKASNDSEGTPPEPFTELSLLPNREEIHVNSKKVFLRSNKIKGSYDSWEHYFDVQFRLLREDFVRPLRNGISNYCDTGSSRKISDIRVYEGARILNPVCLFTGIGFQLRFDSSKLHHVNWEHSRRLIFGSLLCLSNDKFDRSLLFATVVKRDPKLLMEGLLTIKFENDVNGFQIDPTESFEMVESTAYYEAYRHVLEGLQELSRAPDAMPMQKYIVAGDFGDMKIPLFLRLQARSSRFNMEDIFWGKNSSRKRSNFDITDHSLWPQARCTDLDESQLHALKMALTREVAVIQGPPGTGKTYIGHKIVEAYLKNRTVWDPEKTAPILVVCYTNHALDQFLEGIRVLEIDGNPPNIVRVGGRCKSDMLADCILTKKVQECRTTRSVPRHIYANFMQARTALFDDQNFINKKIENSDAESKQKIIGIKNLEPAAVMEEVHSYQLVQGAESTGKAMEEWLGLWFPEEQVPQTEPEQRELALNDDISSDDEYIQVDNEARILQEERMIEGEEIEIPNRHRRNQENVTTQRAKKSADQYGWKTVQFTDGQRKKLMSKGFKNNPMTDEEASRVTNIWNLNHKQRWKLYLHWTNEYMRWCKDQVNERANAYNATCMQYRESQQNIESFVAQGTDVIGMTTTGAAKYHHLLKSIRPKIVIFEEAAEVLEAHVTTSLATSVQQLVMIGDHKQLRPKPTCYDLEKDYNLDVSLFERLIKNGFEHVTLEKQHRMRPEISKLVCPIIYEKLLDADNVKKYGHVMGIEKDVFFVDHTQPEEPNFLNDLKSHVNKFEAEYTVELCHYLLKQGIYSPGDITILTMYRGQLLELRKRMKRQHFEGVRVAAVDDFQGEENEIILLSLVRSNSENSVGFLKIENRVCVSLSRAKQGLYVIGNLSMLREERGTKWPDIIRHLEKEKCVGYGLPLYCQVHPDDKIAVQKPDQFKQRPEGGCTRVCGTRLSCGHACERICHPKDRQHKYTTCSKVCGKPFPCGHNCKRKCYQCKKNQKCAPCSVHVEKVLPRCHHKVKILCSTNPATTPCPLSCDQLLPCGHQCQNTCSAPCTVHCKVKITKNLPCEHSVEICCFENPDSVICPMKCETILECDDKCSGTCGKCQHGRLHVKCLEKCGRDLVCGHNCKFPCASICPPCEEHCNNYCIHSKCPKKCYERCDPCMEQCEWKCPHFKCTKPCGQLCNRPTCDLPCKKRLQQCNHQCIGLCGEKCPEKCRICDKDEVREILFGDEDEDDALFIELQDCGHIIEVGALDKWMKTNDSKSNSDSTSTDSQVQFKACPKCKTSIRKSLRYGNIIKEVLKDVEAIKSKQAVATDDLKSKFIEARKEVQNHDNAFVLSDLGVIREKVYGTQSLNWYHATTIQHQLSLLPKLSKVNSLLDNFKQFPAIDISGCSPDVLRNSLLALKKFLMQESLSTQQISDSIFELRRLTCAAKLLDLQCKIKMKKCAVSPSDHRQIVREVEQVFLSGYGRHAKLTEERSDTVNKFIQSMSTKYEVEGLSKEERLQIVAAIGLTKGHWYKCPKGHYYCIGECGGATQESKCPDCKSTIGGQNHALAAGNMHAGEMDDSPHAAWSDAANNLENWDPNELARLRR